MNGLAERAWVIEEIGADAAVVTVREVAAYATGDVKTSSSSWWQRQAVASRGDAARAAPGMGVLVR